MSKKSAAALALDNTDKVVLQPAYHQLCLIHDKPILVDQPVSRKRAARECYRQRKNFMRFILENPCQRDTYFIDSYLLLRWLGLMA